MTSLQSMHVQKLTWPGTHRAVGVLELALEAVTDVAGLHVREPRFRVRDLRLWHRETTREEELRRAACMQLAMRWWARLRVRRHIEGCCKRGRPLARRLHAAGKDMVGSPDARNTECLRARRGWGAPPARAERAGTPAVNQHGRPGASAAQVLACAEVELPVNIDKVWPHWPRRNGTCQKRVLARCQRAADTAADGASAN
jgi:hypothetical protein